MSNFLGKLAMGGVSQVIDSAAGMARIFVNDKSAAESNIHDEQISAQESLTAEAASQVRENRTWWDSLVDGLNRLPRPFMAFMAIGVLVWCPIDPQGFSTAMVAFQLVPNWLAAVVAQVFILFCGGRMLNDHFDMKTKTVEETKAILSQINQMKTPKTIEVPEPDPYKIANKISDKDYREQMADNSKPLSLDAIVEWNKRKGNG